MKLISIAIPCYRSAKTLPFVVKEIQNVFSKQDKYEYEIVLVNDGSPDNTYEVIQELCKEDDRITGVDLSQNFGQGSAKMAAMSYIHGDVMVTMDDDGQHPAEGIFLLVEKVFEGYDLVYAHFRQKKQSVFRKVTSWMNSKFLSLMGSKSSDLNMSSFAAYSSFSIKMIKQSKSPVTALTSYVRKLTKRVTDVEITQRERFKGGSTYTLSKLFKLWRNNITSFSTRALSFAIYLGTFTAFAGFIYAFYIFIRKLITPNMVVGYASIMIAILVLSGIIMILLGILGEYLGKIFLILVKLPNFVIRDEIPNKFCE